MSITLSILLVLASALTLFSILKKIRSARVQIEYAIFWILFAIALLLIAIFPGVIIWLSNLVGFQSPTNMVFLIIIFVLIIRLFQLCLQVSQLEYKLRELTQKIALDRAESESSAPCENTPHNQEDAGE